MAPGVELIVIMAIFLGLLCVGIDPFAIVVPSVLYLLTHNGLVGLKGLGFVDLGQHEQLHAVRHPAVHPDGGTDAAQRPVVPDLSRPRQDRFAPAGRIAADQHRRLRAVRVDQRVLGRDGGVDRRRGVAATGAAQL